MICGSPECGKEFQMQTHNQKYCDAECCRIATNARIKEKYHADRARRQDSNRRCNSCGNKMSVYNMDYTCGPCQRGVFSNYTKEILEYLGVTDRTEKD